MTVGDVGTGSGARRGRAFRGIALRVCVSAVIVAILIARTDLGRIVEVLARGRIGFQAAALGAMMVLLVVGSIRWQAFLRALGLALPAPTALRLYLVGTFFNAFLPTGVGGDVYKAYRLRTADGGLAPPVTSVILDRLAGLVGLALIGAVAVLSRVGRGDHRALVFVAGALSLSVLAAVALGWLGRSAILRWLSARSSSRSLWSGVRSVAVQASAALGEPRAAGLGLAGGLLAQGLTLAAMALLLGSLGADLPLDALATVMVVAGVAASLPITVNGLGVREGTLVWALGAYGMPTESALAFAILVLGLLLMSSAIGGLVYVVAGGAVERGGTPTSEGLPTPGRPR